MVGRLTPKVVEARVQPHLPPGEQLIAAFQAEVGHDPTLRFRHRVVAVTDVGIHMFSARWLRACSPKELLASFRATTVIRRHRRHLRHEEFFIEDLKLSANNAWSDELFAAIHATETR